MSTWNVKGLTQEKRLQITSVKRLARVWARSFLRSAISLLRSAISLFLLLHTIKKINANTIALVLSLHGISYLQSLVRFVIQIGLLVWISAFQVAMLVYVQCMLPTIVIVWEFVNRSLPNSFVVTILFLLMVPNWFTEDTSSPCNTRSNYMPFPIRRSTCCHWRFEE